VLEITTVYTLRDINMLIYHQGGLAEVSPSRSWPPSQATQLSQAKNIEKVVPEATNDSIFSPSAKQIDLITSSETAGEQACDLMTMTMTDGLMDASRPISTFIFSPSPIPHSPPSSIPLPLPLPSHSSSPPPLRLLLFRHKVYKEQKTGKKARKATMRARVCGK
jgi:hypothetical protein